MLAVSLRANGYNSTVKANTIGSADTVVHGGMVDGTAYETARANAGGIVGTNYGQVSLTDNSQKEEGNTTIDNYLAIPVVLLDDRKGLSCKGYSDQSRLSQQAHGM